jgi:hypothetical protein
MNQLQIYAFRFNNKRHKLREGCKRKSHSERSERGIAAGQPDGVAGTPKETSLLASLQRETLTLRLLYTNCVRNRVETPQQLWLFYNIS